ncbi:restriction endonuclease subunit S [Campylobacter devanensis]|uniref:restriction endonuclease subunit S n=1 Tax=Campylobacter devanensis TaxID=3161138 RepID=UPI000A34911F|nr:restriction endonuclease subunit S [Campylobacter sp. P0094]
MNKKKEIVPKLRFPEYIENKLKITKLGKISSVVKEKAGEDKYTLMSVTSGVGLIPQAEKFGREIAGASYKNYIVIKKYDFAYNKSATKQFPEGYISMLGKYDIAAVPNSIFTCFRITDNESYPLFFDYLWHNNYHGHWLRKYIEVSARAHGALSVDTKHLWSMPLALPDLKEQQKIADCLSSIDELIDAESRKLRALEKYKKGLMQKLFPAEGKTLPEWRFSEFKYHTEWNVNKLGNLCSITTGKLDANAMVTDGKYRFYTCAKEFFQIDKYAFDTEALLISGNGNVGYIHYYKGKFNAYQRTYVLDQFYENIHYVQYYLERNLSRRINTEKNEGNMPYIVLKTLTDMDIFFPKNLKEQQKIADCLSEVDTMITEQSNKVKQLKSHKKGLMQGLFPSLEEANV